MFKFLVKHRSSTAETRPENVWLWVLKYIADDSKIIAGKSAIDIVDFIRPPCLRLDDIDDNWAERGGRQQRQVGHIGSRAIVPRPRGAGRERQLRERRARPERIRCKGGGACPAEGRRNSDCESITETKKNRIELKYHLESISTLTIARWWPAPRWR